MDLSKAPAAEIAAAVKFGTIQLDEIPTAKRELVANVIAGKANEDEIDEQSRGTELDPDFKPKPKPAKKGKKKDAKKT